MIRYALKCDRDHAFDGWFRNSAAFDDQVEAGHVACAICGSAAVEKAVMAPAVPARGERVAPPSLNQPSLSQPSDRREAALRALRQRIETTSDYVGREFAAEARRMHDGESDKRAVWGEASLEEARKLHEDGIPAMPIPWMSRRDD